MDKIFVVTHVKPDSILPEGYEYIGVGPKDYGLKLTDKSGDSISQLNSYFSELTALYWIWKNHLCDPDDVIGLVHYRRVLLDPGLIPFVQKRPASLSTIKALLQEVDIVLPQAQYLRPDAYHNYGAEHVLEDLDMALSVAEAMDGLPQGTYKNALIHMKENRMCNVLITRKHVFDRYCAWLFPILLDVLERIDTSERSAYQKRVFGFLSERLFNIWLFKEKSLRSASLMMIRTDFSALKNWNRRRLNVRALQKSLLL